MFYYFIFLYIHTGRGIIMDPLNLTKLKFPTRLQVLICTIRLFTLNLIADVFLQKNNKSHHDVKLKQAFGIYQCNKQARTNIVSLLFV